MYSIEQRLASKNGWFTPAEARNYYGRYDRHGITWHWWGLPSLNPDSAHNNIVNYILGKASRGEGSVNYVLSNTKVTLMVGPDNVAWASQGGNATTVSVELSPNLNAEGYKKAGWLAKEIAARYGGDRKYYPHNHWFATQCPGTISLDRIRQEEDKWQRGDYNPQPTPSPTPTPQPPAEAIVTFSKITPGTYVCNKQPTNLYQVNKGSWGSVGVVKQFNKGDRIDVYGVVKNATLKGEWYVTKYSFDNQLPNGFSKADLDPYVAPVPTPPPAMEPQVTPLTQVTKMYTLSNAKLVNIKDMSVVKQFALDTPMEVAAKALWQGKEFYLTKYGYENKTNQGFLVGDLKPTQEKPNPEPTPPEPTPDPEPEKPEWEKNLRDIDDTKYWLKADQKLIDITTGKPAVVNGVETVFEKDDEFVSSAVTFVGTQEYRITEYSYQKGIFNGLPIQSLTLTPPGLPDIDPIPENPDYVSKNVVILFLESIVKLITDFIGLLRK
jgi:hypothetical protein